VSSGRYFVYRYDGDADSDDVEFDRHGAMAIPKQGSVVERKGATWRVDSVQVEATESAAVVVPIFRVFLSRCEVLPRET